MSDDEVRYYTNSKEHLKKLVKENATCPPRVVFSAQCDQGASQNLSCKITLKGASVKGFDEEPYFVIPKIPPSRPQPPTSSENQSGTPRQNVEQVVHPPAPSLLETLNLEEQSSGYRSNLKRSSASESTSSLKKHCSSSDSRPLDEPNCK